MKIYRKLLLVIVGVVGFCAMRDFVSAGTVTCQGSYGTPGGYQYPSACSISCPNGGYGTLSYDAIEVPNHFSIGGVNTALNGGRVGWADEPGPWNYNTSQTYPWLIASAMGSYNFTFSSSTSLRVDTSVPSASFNKTDARYASVDYTCNGAPDCFDVPDPTEEYQCSGSNRQKRTYNGSPGVCAWGAWSTIETCTYGCSNNACVTPPPCGGSIPSNGQACNSTAPSSATNWEIVSSCGGAGACKYQCVNGTVPSGSTCVTPPPYTQYACQINGNWQSNGSCTSYNYTNTPNLYSPGNTVCLQDPNTPDDSSCDANVSCGTNFASCVNSSATNLNTSAGTRNCGSLSCSSSCSPSCYTAGSCNNSSPGQCNAGSSSNAGLTAACSATVNWICYGSDNGSSTDDANCSYTNTDCAIIDGVCGGSNFSCNAGTYQYVNGSQRRCNGINGGSSATCNTEVSPYCGDGSVNQSWEQCEGSMTTNSPAFRTCVTSSCQWGGCASSYQCVGANGRQRNVDADCNIDGSIETAYGYCCQGTAPNAYWQSATAAGSSISNVRCVDGMNIAWDQPNGNCGVETTVKRCDDWSGRPGPSSTFGPNGADRSGFSCRSNSCQSEPNLYTNIYICNLTGVNLAQRCEDVLPVNMPFGGYWPPAYGGAVFIGAETVNGKWKDRDRIDDMYVGLLNNAGVKLIDANNPVNPTSANWRGGISKFSRLGVGQSYHSYVTYDANVIGMNLPDGWVQVRGPSSGAVAYNLSHWSALGGGSVGWSSIINPSSGLRITMGNDKAYGNYYFYCSNPSGICPKPYRFSINTFYDRDDNGIGGSDGGLGNVLIHILSGGVLLYSGYTKADGNQPGYHDWYNGTNPYDKKGSFTVSLLGGSTYTVMIYPPMGYTSAASAPYHYVGASDLNNGSSVNSAGLPSIPWGWDSTTNTMRAPIVPGPVTGGWTSLSGTAFTITMPESDTYTRTRLSGVPANLSLETSIVNPQLGYSVGDTIQINYLLKNIGYSSLDQTLIFTHILTGLQMVPNSMVFSGGCDSESWGAPRSPTGHPLGRRLSSGSVTSCGSLYYPGNDSLNCSCVTPGYAACSLTFLNKSFITWTNNGGGPVIDQSIYPGVTYPPLATDLDTVGQNNYDGAYKKVVPKGHLVSIGRGQDDAARIQPGAVCEVKVSYQIQPSAVTGQTYTYRSCARPRSSSDLSIPWIQDNCDNVQVRIGLPNCALPPAFGTGTIAQGSGIVARRDNLITPSDGITRCESEYRTCDNTVLSGSFMFPSCVRQCFQTWTGSYGTTGIDPGSTITGQASLRSNSSSSPSAACTCEQAPLNCVATQITGGSLGDPSGRPYTGGLMQGLLQKYVYPNTMGCQQDPTCNPSCQDGADVDLYEIHYSMSGNTVLSQNRVVDQVHPNVCIKPSSFTGRIASNEVRITFFSGSNTGISYPGLVDLTGSLLSNNTGKDIGLSYTNIVGQTTTGYVCGPYVQYEFVKPLNPGAEGYFFYQYRIKDSVSQNPNANSGDNCVWIYRQSNTGVSYGQLPPTILTALSTSGLAALDPGDWAQRFVNSWNTWTIFNPLGELTVGGNNYVCVPPPTSICPANTVQQNTLFPINICGNGVQELNEECDEGANNNNVGSPTFTGLPDNDKLYGNYCKTDCTLGYPLACNWKASCSNANVTSIQSGEQYPFWWNFGSVLASGVEYNTGFTSICNQSVHANKIIYAPGVSVPMCTFELYNFDLSTGVNLYEFTAPCVGTGIADLPMFDPNADLWEHEKEGTTITSIDANQLVTSSTTSDTNIIPSIDKYTLDQIRTNILESQGSRIIPMTNIVTKGRLGEYEIRLTKLSYVTCAEEAVYTTDINGAQSLSGYIYTLKTGNEVARGGFCSNQFIVTTPYTIQEGSLLSTLDPADFSKFYTSATRLSNTELDNTYGNLLTRNTQIPTYISILGTNSQSNQEFISQFIGKYTSLAGDGGQPVLYSHSFKGLSGAQSSAQVTLFKVPTREVYVYTGTQPLFVSDYGFNSLLSNNPLRSSQTLTIISTNASIVVFGDLKTKNIMLITSEAISFAGGSLLKKPQQVGGIFVAATYNGAAKLDNTDSSKRWIDDGRLVVHGILIGGNIESLSQSRRSLIENWYNGSGTLISDSAVLAKRKKSLIEGASLRIVPNPQLFISPPPGATELFESLSVVK